MVKKTFDEPNQAEREYTRLLLRFTRELKANVNRVLIPKLPQIYVEYLVESRADSWVETLDQLIIELMALATQATTLVVRRLPGQFEAVSKFNERQFKMVVKANTGLELPPVALGAPTSALLGVNVFRNEPFLAPLAEGWVRTNTDLIKSIPTQLNSGLEGMIRRSVMNGSSIKDLKAQIQKEYNTTDYRAKLIAQDQTLKLNADLTRYRLQSVGVKEYHWRTVNDSRVRDSHIARNGKVYNFDKPPAGGLHPGQEVRCRCRAEAIFEKDD